MILTFSTKQQSAITSRHKETGSQRNIRSGLATQTTIAQHKKWPENASRAQYYGRIECNVKIMIKPHKQMSHKSVLAKKHRRSYISYLWTRPCEARSHWADKLFALINGATSAGAVGISGWLYLFENFMLMSLENGPLYTVTCFSLRRV